MHAAVLYYAKLVQAKQTDDDSSKMNEKKKNGKPHD